jgi:hypothetical protein
MADLKQGEINIKALKEENAKLKKENAELKKARPINLAESKKISDMEKKTVRVEDFIVHKAKVEAEKAKEREEKSKNKGK